MLKRIVAILLLICLLPAIPASAENDSYREEFIVPDEVPRGENGENQFLVPIAFKDNNLPKPMGPVYDDKTPKDFNKNSPALYTAKMTEYTSGYPTPTIYGVLDQLPQAEVQAAAPAEEKVEAVEPQVEEIEEIPGGYYVSRAIDQAFWNVLTMNENPKDMMKKWGEVADVEIETKIEQYKEDRKEGNG